MEPLLLCAVGAVALIVVMLLSSAIKVVPENERLAIYRLGRYIGEKGPGLVFMIPVIDTAQRVDLRKERNADSSQRQSDPSGFSS
jgi:regulator of protease activity HflC (stomatin/prohibitin superfamily)